MRHNPFVALSGAGLPPASKPAPSALQPAPPAAPPPPEKNRGRVDIRRETGGRGGKTVTVIDGFVGIGLPEKEQLAKKLRAACGCGGTVKDGAIEIQGDQRETAGRIMREAGFRPVLAGG
ncbi:MAG: translation initiation factor [Verrucomicrobia bacterium]|nr:translation initiation factor [Verrucomicrobiota bacterium]